MAKKIETPSVLKQLSDSEPLILVGEPKRIRGKLNLTNMGAEEVVIQNAHLRTTQAKIVPGRKTAQKPRLEISHPLQPIIVRPGRSRSVSVKMALDPYTAPGEYDAELEVSGEIKPVKVHVTEKIDLSVSPDKIIIRDAPGSKVTKRIILTNNGNVPLSIGEIGAIILEDERLECRVMRRVLAAIDTQNREAKFEDYFRIAIAQAQNVLLEAGALRIHNKTGSITLEPGSTQVIDLEIQIPESLDRRTRYTASVALYNENLSFEIAPILGDLPGKVK